MGRDYLTDPKLIEQKSMEIINQLVGPLNISEQEKKVVFRVVHTTGDPDIAKDIIIHPSAIETAKEFMLGGGNIVTDVNMVKSGISSAAANRLGLKVICSIHLPGVGKLAQDSGLTRAMASITHLQQVWDRNMVVIGNAPTALFRLLEIIDAGHARPAFIIASPVGFVGAAEAKEELVKYDIPFIAVRGRKGGSNVAAAITNALLYMTLAETQGDVNRGDGLGG